MQRRLCALLLATLLVTTLLPGVVLADSKISVSEAIQLAKAAFPEVSFPNEFSSSYEDNGSQGLWYLRWSSQAGKVCEVNVNVNGTTGEIVGFNYYLEPDPSQVYAALPKLTQEDSLRFAVSFLQKIAPGKYGECNYLQEAPPRPFLSTRNWQQRYYFQFVRQVNGIPCPANGISVSVDGDTGEIVSYALNWNELNFPSLDNVIDTDQAASALQEKGGLELQYIWPYVERGEQAKPILAYVYPNINNIYIDAHTGEVKSDVYYLANDQLSKKDTVAGAGDTMFTPQEWAEIEYIKGLLTQDAAAAKARDLLGIAPELELTQARLTKDVSFLDLRTWQLTFNSKPSNEYYDVRIDAKTGELYHVTHYWNLDESLSEGTLAPLRAKQVADAFMQKYNPEKAAQVKLVSMPVKETEQNPLYYSFNYRRSVNGIPFTNNYINVTVRAEQAGLITDYDVRWVEADFPDPAVALTKADAYDKLLDQYPLLMEYRLVRENTDVKQPDPYVQSELKAVLTYRLEETANSLFSADQMAPIDYRGKVIKLDKPGIPQDVDGSFASAEIKFLAKVGIIQLEDGLYHPDQNITVGEWLELLSRAAGWATDNPIISLPQWATTAMDKPYVGAAQAAIAAGLILPGENVDMSKSLTREDLALFAIRALGYEKVAAIPGIYQLTCKDAKDVSLTHIGHVAIARGLGIMVGDLTYFHPQTVASKAECATVVMRMLGIKR